MRIRRRHVGRALVQRDARSVPVHRGAVPEAIDSRVRIVPNSRPQSCDRPRTGADGHRSPSARWPGAGEIQQGKRPRRMECREAGVVTASVDNSTLLKVLGNAGYRLIGRIEDRARLHVRWIEMVIKAPARGTEGAPEIPGTRIWSGRREQPPEKRACGEGKCLGCDSGWRARRPRKLGHPSAAVLEFSRQRRHCLRRAATEQPIARRERRRIGVVL